MNQSNCTLLLTVYKVSENTSNKNNTFNDWIHLECIGDRLYT